MFVFAVYTKVQSRDLILVLGIKFKYFQVEHWKWKIGKSPIATQTQRPNSTNNANQYKFTSFRHILKKFDECVLCRAVCTLWSTYLRLWPKMDWRKCRLCIHVEENGWANQVYNIINHKRSSRKCSKKSPKKSFVNAFSLFFMEIQEYINKSLSIWSKFWIPFYPFSPKNSQ